MRCSTCTCRWLRPLGLLDGESLDGEVEEEAGENLKREELKGAFFNGKSKMEKVWKSALFLNKSRETRWVCAKKKRVLQNNPFEGQTKGVKNPEEKKGSLDLCSS